MDAHPFDVQARLLMNLRFLHDGYSVSFREIARASGVHERTVRQYYWQEVGVSYPVLCKVFEGVTRLMAEREKAREAALRARDGGACRSPKLVDGRLQPLFGRRGRGKARESVGVSDSLPNDGQAP